MVQLQQYGQNAVVSQFLDQLALQRPEIDLNLIAYVWGIRSNAFATEKAVLLGRAILPMTDWKLQRKMIPWSITDIPTGQLVGEMVLKFQVLTTPGPPLAPKVSDVGRKEVTLHWSPPANDCGSPVIGYKIDLKSPQEPKKDGSKTQKEARPTSDPEWICLCELTEGL